MERTWNVDLVNTLLLTTQHSIAHDFHGSEHQTMEEKTVGSL